MLLSMVAIMALAVGCGSESQTIDAPLPTREDNAAEATPAPPLPTPVPIVDLEDARRALHEGRFEEAAEAFAAFASGSADAAERASAYLSAAVGWQQAGEADLSIEALREAYTAAPARSQVRRRAGYLYGERLSERGEHERAADTLQPLYSQPVDDALQPYIDAAFALAAANAGETELAAAAWQRASDSAATPDSLRVSMLQQRVGVARDANDLNTAAALLEELVSLAPTSTDRFALAEVAVNRGDRATWEAQMRRIITDFPASRQALLAVETLERNNVATDPGSVGYVYYRHGQYALAREILGEAVEEPGLEPHELVFRTYYLAAAHDDAGLFEEGIPIYDRVPEIDAESPFAHRARYWAARSAESMGDVEEAVGRYVALVSESPVGEFSAESAFRAGYLLLGAGEPERAVETWESLDVATGPRAQYWHARAYEEMGEEEEAAARYEELATSHPFNFHGLEAAVLLGEREPASPEYREIAGDHPEPDWDRIAAWLAGDEDAVAPGPATTAADDFAGVGLHGRARQALSESSEEPLARLRAASDLQLTDTAARIATILINASGQPLTDVPVDLLRLAYPLRYVSYLDSVSSHYGFDPLFLAALIRTESFWHPGARSHADAMGLTQVIPTTGDLIAAALGEDDWVVGDLFRPTVSLRYGGFYLGEQLERFDDPHLALAAYNGGPGNAVRWSEAAPGARPGDLLEVVTFVETRSYLQLVMSAYAVYEHIYRDTE